jgi:hypothetical protein
MRRRVIYWLLAASLAGNAVEGAVPLAREVGTLVRMDRQTGESRNAALWNYVVDDDHQWQFDSLEHEQLLLDRRIDSLVKSGAPDSLELVALLDECAVLARGQYQVMHAALRVALGSPDSLARRKAERRWRQQMGLPRARASGQRR